MHLDVSRCRNLVDRAIKQACTGLKNLRSINASYCDRLQRPEFSGANLQSIKLVGCIGVTKITIDQCPVLEVVDLRGCRRLEASEVIYTSEVRALFAFFTQIDCAAFGPLIIFC